MPVARRRDPDRGRSEPGALVAFGIDASVVVAFVVIGRRSHDEGSGLATTFAIAAPFLLGLGTAWLATLAWRAPRGVVTGVRIWAVTTVVGLGLRRVGFDRGVAVAFVVVSCAFLGAGMVGWRAVAQRVASPVGS